ncbi:MAG TPA: sugar phosphate isomerase/epimerase [Chloroflexota bacterium]|nr:sugar phosphate isomerase/epimerase [Chloroflexota bacterium]
MRLGIDSYSLKDQGWDAFQMLDYSASMGLDNVHFSERGNFASLESEYLLRLKAHADSLGLTVEVGMGSFNRYAQSFKSDLGSGEQQLADMIDAAVAMGSPVVRCFMGMEVDRTGKVPFAEQLEECVRTLRAVAPKAREAGIRIGVENHGGVDLLARELRTLIETVGTDVAGACLDTGNPAYGAEDPLLSAEILAPYVVTSHVRDTRIWADERGAQAQWAPLGQGNVDLHGILAILREKAPNVPVDLEIITGRAPKALPYFDSSSTFWTVYPQMLAQDFARFVALAVTGAPGALDQVTVAGNLASQSPEVRQAFREQQRRHFEASVQYARNTLGLGERGR